MTEFSTIVCNHFPTCPGCERQTQVFSPPIWQEMLSYFSQKNITPTLFHAEVLGFRVRAKLAVRGTSLLPQIGLFKRGTHEVVSIVDCPLHHASINQAATLIRRIITETGIAPYCEKSRSGELRYLQLSVERSTKKIQLVLVVNTRNLSSSFERFIDKLKENDLWHSIWVNFQTITTNRIFGDQWKLCDGKPDLWEFLGGNQICFHPASFSQAHLSLFDKMLSSIEQEIMPNKKVVEFYAGVGVIGLSILKKSKSLICTEINPFAKDCFAKTKQRLEPCLQEKVSFIQGDAKELLSLVDDAETVIVDPPRKGIDASLLKRIADSNVKELIYVSCGFQSFQKDAQELIGSGFELVKADGYLLFPGTDHVETLAIFRRL